ncbi:DinB family protein [Sediminicola sp. YIK13]|uniref:DinB family protein n=1 Tax=Sediminicola sp. YIK13 TaxID=1453352 RepID=UPI00071ED859|nr:DinB family protein [Sediminicola sp. YIK13]ALM08363.1 DinB family protein [Sediminicola sp. YIK13]
MKIISFILLSLFLNQAYSQDLTIPTFLEKWENSKTYLLEVAQAMPLEQYDYKPTSREMTFVEQLKHIQQNMEWLGSTYFNFIKPDGTTEESKDLKSQTILELSNAFDLVGQAIKNATPEDLKTKVDFFAGEKTKFQILNLLQDHVTHHRGQLIVYLNLNNIEPPKYTGW